ncbi:hypothetical protein [Serratia liquefaciens]|uniref:hypothetical protein n=1 Tax=Serratia liquefaciens TaxID=614 RepID=UPI0015A2AD3D|nr:hypothetical protein [Serratia liquefaciens]
MLNRTTLLGSISMLLLLLALLPSLLKMINVSAIPTVLNSAQDDRPSPHTPPSEDTGEPKGGKHQVLLTDNDTLPEQAEFKIRRGENKILSKNLADSHKCYYDLSVESASAKFNFQIIQQEVKKFVRKRILSRRRLAGLSFRVTKNIKINSIENSPYFSSTGIYLIK